MNIRVIPVCFIAWLACAGAQAAETVEIREWQVPWENTGPRDPCAAADGRIWFVGQNGDYVANLYPETGEFSRYDLQRGAGPHNLIVGPQHKIWYAGNRAAHIGLLDPDSGQVIKIEMPDRSARDPHTLVFDDAGNIWFTVQQGNFVGRLDVENHAVQLMKVKTGGARPYGITVNSNGIPWVAAYGSNRLIRVNPEAMTLEEIDLPDENARPRRLVITADDRIWYGDFARGYLGRYDPDSGEFAEWPLPGGADSLPYGMEVDKFDRVWVVETGRSPNQFVGFDTKAEEFFSVTEIPSGAGAVRNMDYFEPAGEIWFGTDRNTIGRAKVH